jgi:hypothetical protein
VQIVAVIVLAVLFALGVRHLYNQRPSQKRRRQIQALLQECNGDQDLVERLIFVEMQRDEAIDYAEAARRARSRLKRDRV